MDGGARRFRCKTLAFQPLRRKIGVCRVDGRVNPWKNSKHKRLRPNLMPRPLAPRRRSGPGSARPSNCNANASSPSGPPVRIGDRPSPTPWPISRRSSLSSGGPCTCSFVRIRPAPTRLPDQQHKFDLRKIFRKSRWGSRSRSCPVCLQPTPAD